MYDGKNILFEDVDFFPYTWCEIRNEAYEQKKTRIYLRAAAWNISLEKFTLDKSTEGGKKWRIA